MRTGVVTPEAVVLELPTAGVATRAFARIVDLIVQVVVFMGLFTVVGVVGGSSQIVLAFGVVFFVLLVMPIGIELVWRGRSIGKALFGLRVVGADGAPEVPRQAMVRGLVALIDIYLSLGFLALVTAMFSPSSQRPGDLAAGSVVIREPRKVDQNTPIAFHPPYGFEDYVRTLDVSALRDEDFSLIREFLLRVRQLSQSDRSEIAAQLAERTRVAIHHTLPGPVDPETWLICVASAFQLRQGGLLADAALGLAPLAPRT